MNEKTQLQISRNDLDVRLNAFGGNWPHRKLIEMRDALDIDLPMFLNWGAKLEKQEILDKQLSVKEFEAIMALEGMVKFFCRNGQKEPAELGKWLREPQPVTVGLSPIAMVFEDYDDKGVDLDNVHRVIKAAEYFVRRSTTYKQDFNEATWRWR